MLRSCNPNLARLRFRLGMGVRIRPVLKMTNLQNWGSPYTPTVYRRIRVTCWPVHHPLRRPVGTRTDP
jgi:hypothetical protein